VTAEVEIPQCTGHTRSGERCTKRPIVGGTVCYTHGGATEQVKAKARERLLHAKLNGELVKLGWEPVIDPISKYAEVGGEVLAFKDLARERVNELAGKWETPAEGFIAEDTRAAVQVYERALDRAERTLARMIGIGFTAHAHRLAEDRGHAFLGAMRAMLADPRVTVDGNPDDVLFDALKALEGR